MPCLTRVTSVARECSGTFSRRREPSRQIPCSPWSCMDYIRRTTWLCCALRLQVVFRRSLRRAFRLPLETASRTFCLYFLLLTRAIG